MPTSRQLVQDGSAAPENISVLIATPHPEDLNSLRQILHHGDWSLSFCTSAHEAVECASRTRPAILICERDLPDGTWRDVLQQMQSLPNPPLVLVSARHADEGLWAEVLNIGGYDVLLRPFDRSEVTRVIGMAWRQWRVLERQPVGSTTAPGLTAQYA